jgi:hypothetical protein
MTIDQAIIMNLTLHKYLEPGTDKEFLDAIKLGIEALKQVKLDRSNIFPFRSTLLPGETEE